MAEGRKVFALEGHRGDRIARIGVEAGGNEQEIGAKRDDGVEGGPERGHVLGARGVGGDGPVAEARTEVARASAGVAGVLVDRGKEECIAERRVGADEGLHNGFGAVAVMGVEIPDGHTTGGDGSGSVGGSAGGREGGREIVGGVNSRERDLVQITETHRMARAGVVAGRPHEGKNRSALRDGVTSGREGGRGGATGVVADVLEEGGVRVEVAGLRTPLRAVDIGFGIGPRLNAAGRLDSATAALELLLTDDPARAQSLARLLDQQNRERRAIEDEVLGKAGAQIIGAYDPAGDAAIVVGDAGWHPGVVGIVASRLLRRYHRPTFVIGFDAMGIGKGSGRSIEGFSLVAALTRCAPLLEKFGGHEMAAGRTMRQENFAAFRETFAQAAREMIAPENLQRALRLDAELRLAEVNLNLLDEHDALQPFGTANHQPVFFTRGVTLSGEPRMMKDKHWSFNFRHARAEGGAIRAQCRGVWWNAAEEILPPLPWDIAYTVSRNEWNGRVDAQLELRGVRAAAM